MSWNGHALETGLELTMRDRDGRIPQNPANAELSARRF
jgi:hypothetical protein